MVQSGNSSSSSLLSCSRVGRISSTIKNLNMGFLLGSNRREPWKCNYELNPLAGDSLLDDDATVIFDHPPDEGETKPAAGLAVRTAGKEIFEDPGLEMVRDTWSVVAVDHTHPFAALP